MTSIRIAIGLALTMLMFKSHYHIERMRDLFLNSNMRRTVQKHATWFYHFGYHIITTIAEKQAKTLQNDARSCKRQVAG